MGGGWGGGGGGGGEENTEEGVTVLVPQGTEGYLCNCMQDAGFIMDVFLRAESEWISLSVSLRLSVSVCLLSPSLSLPLSTNNRRKLMCMDA